MQRAIVLVSTCNKHIDGAWYYATQLKYVDAVTTGADCAPLLLPAQAERVDRDAVLSAVDGVLLTGSPSNVHPRHFGQPVLDSTLPLDERRDATTFPLIRAAIERGMPLFGICRGMQEINVALGGTLHQAVHDIPNMFDHREDPGASRDEQYGIAHRIVFEPDSLIKHILGGVREISVNSLHGQGIDRLAPGLSVEARADDGLIEAFRVTNARAFSVAVQWHPEWQLAQDPVSSALFSAFGMACRTYRQQKTGGSHVRI